MGLGAAGAHDAGSGVVFERDLGQLMLMMLAPRWFMRGVLGS